MWVLQASKQVHRAEQISMATFVNVFRLDLSFFYCVSLVCVVCKMPVPIIMERLLGQVQTYSDPNELCGGSLKTPTDPNGRQPKALVYK